MKKSVLFLPVIFLLASVLSAEQATAQDKSKEKQDKEVQIQKAIEEQKKAMSDQKKAQDDAFQELPEVPEAPEAPEAFEMPEDVDVQIQIEAADKAGRAVREHLKRIDKSYRWDQPYVFAPNGEQFFFHGFDDDNESTSWEFSRKVKEKTLKSEYSFDVEKSSKSVVMSVMGDCKEGDIRIKIIMPGGKTYSDIVIDEFGNLNWRKSFTLSDTENQDKTGAWKFIISSNEATGYFKISLQAY